MKTPFLFALLCFTLCAVSLSAQSESACDEVFEVAAPMPVAQGCENIVPLSRQLECTRSNIQGYIENRLVVPLSFQEQRDKIVNLTCDFRFVIDRTGHIASVKSTDCPHYLQFATRQASKYIPPLIPGGYNGKKQCVSLEIPVHFASTVFTDDVLGVFAAELGVDAVIKKEKLEPIYKVVEDMPRYHDSECETLQTKEERKDCADKAIFDVVYSNLKYPEEARALGVEDTIVVQFTIGKSGTISRVRAVRGKREDFKAEGVRIVNEYLKEGWIPGKQRGYPVRVQYNLPIKFELNK
jgi:TonB family protein